MLDFIFYRCYNLGGIIFFFLVSYVVEKVKKNFMKALTFLGAATCRGENVSAHNVSGFIKFFLTFSTTYDTKKKKNNSP